MGRRAKPAKVTVDGKRPPARRSSKTDAARVRDLEKRLGEALEQQTATSEILQAISGAQTDAQPVFNAIARSTVRLCEAARCAVWRPEGDLFRCVARCEMTSGGDVVTSHQRVWVFLKPTACPVG